MRDDEPVRLGVLDQVPVFAGADGAAAVRECLRLAEATDALGYHRFWIAEHHGAVSSGCAAPEVLVAAAASRTTSIRIGSGGVLLPYYSPLKVASTFRLLHALFPDRIDLGVGRGPGAGPDVRRLLMPDSVGGDDRHAERMRELANFLDGQWPIGDPRGAVPAVPTGPGAPQLWSLGASPGGARLAGQLGLPFCFAQFLYPDIHPEVMAEYRDAFVPSRQLGAPYGTIAVRVACADDPEQVESLVAGFRAVGRPVVAGTGDRDATLVAGTPDMVTAELHMLAEMYRADELIITTYCSDIDTRIYIYTAVARAFTRALDRLT
jgi:luciferase family oxidoreductase group 1